MLVAATIGPCPFKKKKKKVETAESPIVATNIGVAPGRAARYTKLSHVDLLVSRPYNLARFAQRFVKDTFVHGGCTLKVHH